MTSPLVAIDALSDRIRLVRGQRVMLDSDLAELYGVATKVFNQAIKRNSDRFPADFMFQLTEAEGESLRSQIVTLNPVEPLRPQIADMVSFAILPCLNKEAMKIIDMPGDGRLVSAPVELR